MVYEHIPPCLIEQEQEDNIIVDIFISIIYLSIYSIFLDYVIEKGLFINFILYILY